MSNGPFDNSGPTPEQEAAWEAELNRQKQREGSASRANFKWADQFPTLDIDPIWNGRLYKRKYTLLSGATTNGKSQVLYYSAACCTNKAVQWIDGGDPGQGSVIILTTEDDYRDMAKPRLHAAGAKLGKGGVGFLTSVKDIRDQRSKKFNLLADLDELYKLGRELGDVMLIGIDPINSYLGADRKVDSHNDASMRGALDPLNELASNLECAILGIGHLNKGTGTGPLLHRVNGSVAYANAARSVLFAMPDEMDPTGEAKLLVSAKLSVGKPMSVKTLKYHLAEGDGGVNSRTGAAVMAPRIVWDGHSEVTAKSIEAAQSERGRGQPATNNAKVELIAFLGKGHKSSDDVLKWAKGNGISHYALHEAKRQLGIRSEQVKGEASGGWFWRLPTAAEVAEMTAEQSEFEEEEAENSPTIQ